MELKKFLLEQLESETAASRKVLEKVPEGKNAWKPHAKSMELGYLAALVAGMPAWPAMMIESDEVDLNGEGKTLRTQAVATRAELLNILDKGLAKSREALNKTTDEQLHTKWKLRMGDHVLTDEVRYVAIATGALSHAAHHRGQLTVYLRLNEAPVPAIYGPSADEGK